MTALQIIENIESLPPAEQVEVIRYACRLDAERQLTGAELSSLAERMVNTSEVVEANKLRDSIVQGFYGGKSHA